MDFNNCACSGKTLGRLLQPAVMGLLARQPLHGYVIVQRLASLAMLKGQSPDPAGIYRLLKSMEDDGLVKSAWDLAESGPAKRRFELTASGRACLGRWVRTLERYEQAIDELLASIRPCCGGTRKRTTAKRATRTCCGAR